MLALIIIQHRRRRTGRFFVWMERRPLPVRVCFFLRVRRTTASLPSFFFYHAPLVRVGRLVLLATLVGEGGRDSCSPPARGLAAPPQCVYPPLWPFIFLPPIFPLLLREINGAKLLKENIEGGPKRISPNRPTGSRGRFPTFCPLIPRALVETKGFLALK